MTTKRIFSNESEIMKVVLAWAKHIEGKNKRKDRLIRNNKINLSSNKSKESLQLFVHPRHQVS